MSTGARRASSGGPAGIGSADKRDSVPSNEQDNDFDQNQIMAIPMINTNETGELTHVSEEASSPRFTSSSLPNASDTTLDE